MVAGEVCCGSGGPEESHPRAPTESRRDNLSSPGSSHPYRQCAVTHRHCAKVAGYWLTSRPQAACAFVKVFEPFIFLPQPAHQVAVDALEHRIQRGAVKRPVILHPSPHDGIDPPCEFADGVTGTTVPVCYMASSVSAVCGLTGLGRLL